MTEHKFQIGDKVEYNGGNFQRKGETFTIIGFNFNNQARVKETESFTPYLSNLKLVEPAKEYIQIDRALLPEVKDDTVIGGIMRVIGNSFSLQDSAQAMSYAYQYLAMAVPQAKEAKANELGERRNAVLKEHGFINNYNAVGQPVQSLVNALLAKGDSK